MTKRPKLVYLDQWAWNDLVRGRTDPRLRAARDVCHQARTDGTAWFPLSAVHYMETWAHDGVAERGERAAEMAALSGFLTLRDWDSLRFEEMVRAVQLTFNRPMDSSPKVLGQGVAHALGHSLPVEPSVMSVEERFDTEFGLLWSPLEAALREHAADRHAKREAFAHAEEARRNAWSQLRGTRGYERRFRVSVGFTDFEREWCGALIGNDVMPEEFASLGDTGMVQLLQRAPSVWAFTELRRVRYGDLGHPMRRSDLNDLRALAVALPYCDVVATDRAWADAVRVADLQGWFGTHVVRSLPEVAAALSEGESPPRFHPVRAVTRGNARSRAVTSREH